MSLTVSQAKRAIIYCRVSTNQQEEEGTGLETQEKDNALYCAEHGYLVMEVVHEAHTGYELDERPQLTRIRQLMRDKQVDVVVVWKFDRLARNMAHQGVILYEAEKHGVLIESVKEDLANTPEENLLRTVVAFMAEKERETIKLRTMSGKRRRVERGSIIATKYPLYGYEFNEERTGYIINPETAAIVKIIFELGAKEWSLRKIARTLFDMHIPSPRGSKYWYIQTIRIILGNPAYWGKATGLHWKTIKVVGTSRTTGKTYNYRRFYPNEESVLLPPDVVPAIVSEELAEKAQAAKGKRGGLQRRTHPFGLLDGFVRCGECQFKAPTHYIHERPYYVCRAHGSRPGYHCHNVISGMRMNEEVWNAIAAKLQDPESMLSELLAELLIEIPDDTTLQERVTDLEASQQELIDTIMSMRGASEAIKAPLRLRYQQVAEELLGVRNMLNNATSNRALREMVMTNARRAVYAAADWAKADLDFEQKRSVLSVLGTQIKFYKRDHDPRVEITFSAATEGTNNSILMKLTW